MEGKKKGVLLAFLDLLKFYKKRGQKEFVAGAGELWKEGKGIRSHRDLFHEQQSVFLKVAGNVSSYFGVSSWM